MTSYASSRGRHERRDVSAYRFPGIRRRGFLQHQQRKEQHRAPAYDLGLRYEEIIMLKWSDLDLDAIDVTSGRASPVAHIVPKEGWTPKDGEARAVPMHDRLVEILRPFRKAEGYVLAPAKVMPKRGGTKRVYRYDPKAIWNRVLNKAVEAGAKAVTPHGMRHSFASNLLMAGVSDVLIARWLGHADTSMIHQHYGHLLAYHGDINRMNLGARPSK